MRKKQFGKLISLGLAAALTFTSVVPGGSLTAYADDTEPIVPKLTFSFVDSDGTTSLDEAEAIATWKEENDKTLKVYEAGTEDTYTQLDVSNTDEFHVATDVSNYFVDGFVKADGAYDSSKTYYKAGAEEGTYAVAEDADILATITDMSAFYVNTGTSETPNYGQADGAYDSSKTYYKEGEEAGTYVEATAADILATVTNMSAFYVASRVSAENPYVPGTTYYADATGSETIDTRDFYEATKPADMSEYYVVDAEAQSGYSKASGAYDSQKTYFELTAGKEEVTNDAFPATALPAVPDKTGYTAGKWSYTLDDVEGDEFNADSQTIAFSADFLNTKSKGTGYEAVFTTEYTANNYDVVLDVNGGEAWTDSESPIEVTYDSTYGTLPTPTKVGTQFQEWNTKADGTGLTITAASIVKDTEDDPETEDIDEAFTVTSGTPTLYAIYESEVVLTAGQVSPTSNTSTGNEAIATAWNAASGKEPAGNMIDERNDYHIGVWYASLTGLNPHKTYYLVREYLDANNKVIAVDWGKYSGVKEKFVFSSWGMNLQDESYHQSELKDTIAEVTADTAKVRLTLTTTKPIGQAGRGLKTAIALGWPSIAAGEALANSTYEIYPSISKISDANIISQQTVNRSGSAVSYDVLTVGQVAPTGDTKTGNAAIAEAWKNASGKEASGNMVADNNDYHIGAWYAALTNLDASKTYYLVREYLDSKDSVLAVDWGKYSGVEEKFVFSSWGMNLQDTSYHQRELKDTISEIESNAAKVRFTLTTTKPTGQAGEGLKTAIDLGWPNIAKGTALANDTYEIYPSINDIAPEDIVSQQTVERNGNAAVYGTLTVGQVAPTVSASAGNAVIAEAWKTASGQEASGSMVDERNDYHIGAWYASLTGLDPSVTYYLVREYLSSSDKVLAVDWGTYTDKTEKFVFSSWGMNLQDESYHQRELKETVKEISADVAKVRFTLTTAEPAGQAGKGLKTAIALGWPSIAANTALANDTYEVYPSIGKIADADIISQQTVERNGSTVTYDVLTVGQVAPTSSTSTGNEAIATAWKNASGEEASGNMVADNNDYHIGAWYAALTNLDASKTYYLVREYLDSEGSVLAVDWGTYSGVKEKFVFSSWGMNLQDTSYRQRELKDTISEIDSSASKVRFTLTTTKPTGQAGDGLKTAMALGWPSIADGTALANDTYEIYPTITAIADADIIAQKTVDRNGNTVAYGSLTVGQVAPTGSSGVGNSVIADAWRTASGQEPSGSMVDERNDYHIGAWYAALTGLDASETYYLVREYLSSNDKVLAVDWGTYTEKTEKFVFSSWGMNLQDISYRQMELKDTIKEISSGVAKVRFTLTTTKPEGKVGSGLKTAIDLGWPSIPANTALSTDKYEVYPTISAITDIISQETVVRSGSTVEYIDFTEDTKENGVTLSLGTSATLELVVPDQGFDPNHYKPILTATGGAVASALNVKKSTDGKSLILSTKAADYNGLIGEGKSFTLALYAADGITELTDGVTVTVNTAQVTSADLGAITATADFNSITFNFEEVQDKFDTSIDGLYYLVSATTISSEPGFISRNNVLVSAKAKSYNLKVTTSDDVLAAAPVEYNAQVQLVQLKDYNYGEYDVANQIAISTTPYVKSSLKTEVGGVFATKLKFVKNTAAPKKIFSTMDQDIVLGKVEFPDVAKGEKVDVKKLSKVEVQTTAGVVIDSTEYDSSGIAIDGTSGETAIVINPYELGVGKYNIVAYALEPRGKEVTCKTTVNIVRGIEDLLVTAPDQLYKAPGKAGKIAAKVSYFPVDAKNKPMPAVKKVTWSLTMDAPGIDSENRSSDEYGRPLAVSGVTIKNGTVSIAKNAAIPDEGLDFFICAKAADYDGHELYAYSEEITIYSTPIDMSKVRIQIGGTELSEGESYYSSEIYGGLYAYTDDGEPINSVKFAVSGITAGYKDLAGSVRWAYASKIAKNAKITATLTDGSNLKKTVKFNVKSDEDLCITLEDVEENNILDLDTKKAVNDCAANKNLYLYISGKNDSIINHSVSLNGFKKVKTINGTSNYGNGTEYYLLPNKAVATITIVDKTNGNAKTIISVTNNKITTSKTATKITASNVYETGYDAKKGIVKTKDAKGKIFSYLDYYDDAAYKAAGSFNKVTYTVKEGNTPVKEGTKIIISADNVVARILRSNANHFTEVGTNVFEASTNSSGEFAIDYQYGYGWLSVAKGTYSFTVTPVDTDGVATAKTATVKVSAAPAPKAKVAVSATKFANFSSSASIGFKTMNNIVFNGTNTSAEYTGRLMGINTKGKINKFSTVFHVDEGGKRLICVAEPEAQDLKGWIEYRWTNLDGTPGRGSVQVSVVPAKNDTVKPEAILTVGQVAPTNTESGNAAIAEAWLAASGKEASGNMTATTNDYSIGVWYAALTQMDSAKTYYIVREYLDSNDNVLAADWGTYTGVEDKFVFSSWGMNLQNTSWQQIELKDAITEIDAATAKVRFTLTNKAPSAGEGTRKTAVALKWPASVDVGTDLANETYGVYASIGGLTAADIITQATLTR